MQTLRVSDVCRWLEDAAPKALAAEWDSVGLQCGSADQPVRRILTALTITSGVVDQAVEGQADVVVTHHPLIFKPLAALRPDTRVGSLLYKLVQAGIAVVAAHTNYDAAAGGVNDSLAARLGLKHVRVLEAATPPRAEYKIVTFVPHEAVRAVRAALARAGAGVIGAYTHCTFGVAGQGTFLPAEGAQPHVGAVGELNYVDELRLETVVDEAALEGAVRALKEAHPYEEVPVDVYRLSPVGDRDVGLGRIGSLFPEMPVEEFVAHVENSLELQNCRLAGASPAKIGTVAVVGGAGGSLVARARAAGADALVTGDVDYHDADEARHLGLLVVDAGHFGTEKHVPHELAAYLLGRIRQSGCMAEVCAAREEDPFWQWRGD